MIATTAGVLATVRYSIAEQVSVKHVYWVASYLAYEASALGSTNYHGYSSIGYSARINVEHATGSSYVSGK